MPGGFIEPVGWDFGEQERYRPRRPSELTAAGVLGYVQSAVVGLIGIFGATMMWDRVGGAPLPEPGFAQDVATHAGALAVLFCVQVVCAGVLVQGCILLLGGRGRDFYLLAMMLQLGLWLVYVSLMIIEIVALPAGQDRDMLLVLVFMSALLGTAPVLGIIFAFTAGGSVAASPLSTSAPTVDWTAQPGLATLLSRACTTGWTEWIHGDLWLLSDALVRKRLDLAKTKANGTGPTVRAPLPWLPVGSFDLAEVLGAHRTNKVIPFDSVASAQLRRGRSNDVLRLRMADGARHKLLWLSVDPAFLVLRQYLAERIGDRLVVRD